MNIQELLCQEFCGALSVKAVPCGFAVGTGYQDGDGDAIGFYVVGPDSNQKFRIEDDGLSVAMLEANGVDLTSKTRLEVFDSLLQEYDVLFDEKIGELTTKPLEESQVAKASMRFLAFMLRVQDLLLLSQERVASTFKEDALKLLVDQVKGKAEIYQDEVVHEALTEYPADVVIRAPSRDPVALFFGTSDSKLYEALLLQLSAENKSVRCSIVAMLENTKTTSRKLQQRVHNHLDAVPIFRGAENDAIAKVVKEATGANPLH